MKIDLIRQTFTNKSTIGSLMVDDRFVCYTLEDVVREVPGENVKKWKIQNVTAIPFGTYEVILTMSNRFKRVLPELLNVPGFVGVRIHTGNTAENTEGCILVGDTEQTDFIGNSKVAFEKLFPLMKQAIDRGERIYLTIHDGRVIP